MIVPDDWYRSAWNMLWDVADDPEADLLEQLALRAGVLWRCPEEDCGYCNESDMGHCVACGTPRLKVSN